MREFFSDIIIGAIPEKIWSVLMDFDRYSEWNPIIENIGREAISNNKLNVKIDIPGQKRIDTRLKITKFDPENEFHLKGGFLVPGLLDSQYLFRLDPLDDLNTRFIQETRFSVILTSASFIKSGAFARDRFKTMNRALKQKAEGGPVPANGRRRDIQMIFTWTWERTGDKLTGARAEVII